MESIEQTLDRLEKIYDAAVARLREDHRLRAYLSSDRRMAFNEDGIFRHYPELDAES